MGLLPQPQTHKPYPDLIPVNCSSETCEWENLTTIAITYDCQSTPVIIDSEGFGYSKEANITSGVTTPSSNVSLAHAQIHLKPSLVVPTNSNFVNTDSNSPGLIIHLAAIAEQDNGNFEAAECVLNWVALTWGHTTYNSTSRSLLQSDDYQYPNVSTILTTGSGNDLVINAPCNTGFNITSKEDPSGKECHYTITDNAHTGLRNFLFRTLTGSTPRDTAEPHNLILSNDTIFNLFRSSWQAKSRHSNITDPLNKTLEAYTWNIGKGIGDTVRGLSNDVLSGKVRSEEQMFRINMAYVAFPGCMLCLGIYLLSFAMWRTRREPTWKSSILPFLYHGFEYSATEPGHHCRNLAWMEEASKQNKVVLRDDGDGLGLKLRGC